jgi:hypothetical protein
LPFLLTGSLFAAEGDAGWTDYETARNNDPQNIDEAVELILRENAGRPRITWKNFGVALGYSILGDFKTEIRVDPQRLPIVGTRLRLEDDLGFNSTARIFRVDAFYSFNRYHRIDFSYFDIRRDSKLRTKEEIIWENISIPPTRIDLKFNTRIFKLAYRYNFLVRDDWEIGFGIGVHWMQLDTGIRARTGSTVNNPAIDIKVDETLNQGLPLPLLGLHAAWAPSEDWRIFASIEAFWAKISDYSGRIVDIRVGVDWNFAEWLGVGLYYNSFSLDVEADTNDWKGEAVYSYHGLVVSAVLSW